MDDKRPFVKNTKLPSSYITKLPFGRSYRYFIRMRGFNIRISKDLYMQIKRAVED